MPIATEATAVADAIKQRFIPAPETLEDNVRQVRRAIVHGRYAAEDALAAADLQVRRHPRTAIVLAAGAGALAGCLMGFALGWGVQREKSS
jgi:ElaB/YqjD/DUF883 family membrane-anchored ribosome-binding protein